MQVGLTAAPAIHFNNASLQFQRVGFTGGSQVVIDAEMQMEGDNNILLAASGPLLRVLFQKEIMSPLGTLRIGPGSASRSAHHLDFRSPVDVDRLILGPDAPVGLGNVAFFKELNASDLEVRHGWQVVVATGSSLSVSNLKLTAGTSVVQLSGSMSELMRLEMGGGSLRFSAPAETAPVIHDLSGATGSSIRNLGGERALRIVTSNPNAFGGTFVDDGTGSFSVIKEGSETLTLTANSVLPGTLAIKEGRLKFGTAESSGGIDWGKLELDAELEFASAGTVEYDGEIGGVGKMIQSGMGLTRLSGDGSDFDGEVEVTGGLLEVNGLMGGAAVQVHSGMLGGVGTLGGVVVGTQGAVAPGNSIGTLTLGSLVMAGSQVVEWSAATQMVDLLRVTGLLQLNDATLRFEALDGVGVLAGPMHVIAEYGSLEGRFAQVENLPTGYRLAYGEGGNRIALVAVPEPGVVMGLAMGAMAVLAGRRRGRRD
jgi:hypothetical protein